MARTRKENKYNFNLFRNRIFCCIFPHRCAIIITMWDAVVIGLGGVGSFALRALSQKKNSLAAADKLNLLGLESFTRGHSLGSSHGGSRVYRHAYFEHPNYVPLLHYSTKEFRKLQEYTGVKLLEECGTVIVEEEKDGPIISGCLESSRQHGIPVERLSSEELKQRYPQFIFETNMVGLLERGGGFVRPERAIQSALQEAEAEGATIYEQVKVQSMKEVTDHSSHGASHV
jgi:sarcosine oxidase